MDAKEYRSCAGIGLETRAEDDAPPRIVGYAARFNSLSTDLGGFREVLLPGAFRNTLDRDIWALLGHDHNRVLGRTKNKTLSLREDEHGLRVRITPDPETSAGKDALRMIDRGDIDGMSFGFRAVSDNWRQEKDELIREVCEVELFEVSPTAMPAYPDTSVALRSLKVFSDSRKTNEYERWRYWLDTRGWG